MRPLKLLMALLVLVIAGCGGGGTPQPAASLGDIKIGALFPLSGSNASAGTDARNGVELAADVLNGKYPNIDLPKLTVGRIVLVPGDTQGDPQIGSSDVDRLVSSEKVVALTGAYQSAVTLTASQRAERVGAPFVNGSSSSTALTERGLKWFFRTGPSDQTFAETYFEWLKSIAGDHPVRKAVIFHINDQYGNDGAKVITELAAKNAITIADDISFQPGATDLTSQVQKLRSDAPDAVFVLAFTNDAILFTKTLDQLGYTPPAILAFGAGYADPRFVTALGRKAEFAITRAAWSLEIGKKNPAAKAVAEEFQKKYGQPMTENSARDFTAMMTLGAAIQQAGSTDPEKIRSALKTLNVSKTIMPWKGVKFDDKGQNTLATGVIQQLVNGEYRVVYPADAATTKVVWPMPALSGR